VLSYLLILAIVLCTSPVAVAEDSPAQNPPKPVPRARWSEDWSVLRDVTPLTGEAPATPNRFLRPIKNIPLNASGDINLSLGGEYRIAYELYDKADAGVSEIGFQDALQHRVELHYDGGRGS